VQSWDVIIVGAGASGLMCAATAGYRGRSVLLIEHTKKIGRKILMSGGGRCNFTNIHNGPDNFLSGNPHFCKSALSRYSARDFIELVERHGVEYHEKTLGQLFCNESSKEILNLLMTEADWAGVTVKTECEVFSVEQEGEGFHLRTSAMGDLTCESLVIATGGLSIPNGGATGFAYDVAQQFGLEVTPRAAALVPFTMQPHELEWIKPLSGTSHWVKATIGKQSFTESMLFTHRGLSGPAILQISSYWQPGSEVEIDLFPDMDLAVWLVDQREKHPNMELANLLGLKMTKRLAKALCELWQFSGPVKQYDQRALENIANTFHQWKVKPSGTEGYRTAEVTIGGIVTDAVSQKTMEAKATPGLFFIGECLDVTGHLGGHNFQWAWASGVAAGQAV